MPLRAHGVGLEFRVVGRCQCADLPDMAEIEDGDGQRRSLCGIGSCAQLVKQAEALPVDAAENIYDRRHVGGEGRQTLLDTLLIADIGKYLPEQGQLAAVARGNMKSGHAHKLEKADSLERDSLSARVGAGDDDHIIVCAQFQIDGNHFLGSIRGWRPSGIIDVIFIVENRTDGILVHGKTCAPKNKIQLGHIFCVVLQLHEMIARLFGEGCQNLLNLFFLLQGKFPQLIVEGDDSGGLDEKRVEPEEGLVMYESGDLGFVLGLHRGYSIAVAAHGDHTVMQIGGVGRIDHLRQLLVDPVSGLLDLTANFPEGRRGVVRHLVFRDDAASDLRGERRNGIEAVKKSKRTSVSGSSRTGCLHTGTAGF